MKVKKTKRRNKTNQYRRLKTNQYRRLKTNQYRRLKTKRRSKTKRRNKTNKLRRKLIKNNKQFLGGNPFSCAGKCCAGRCSSVDEETRRARRARRARGSNISDLEFLPNEVVGYFVLSGKTEDIWYYKPIPRGVYHQIVVIMVCDNINATEINVKLYAYDVSSFIEYEDEDGDEGEEGEEQSVGGGGGKGNLLIRRFIIIDREHVNLPNVQATTPIHLQDAEHQINKMDKSDLIKLIKKFGMGDDTGSLSNLRQTALSYLKRASVSEEVPPTLPTLAPKLAPEPSVPEEVPPKLAPEPSVSEEVPPTLATPPTRAPEPSVSEEADEYKEFLKNVSIVKLSDKKFNCKKTEKEQETEIEESIYSDITHLAKIYTINKSNLLTSIQNIVDDFQNSNAVSLEVYSNIYRDRDESDPSGPVKSITTTPYIEELVQENNLYSGTVFWPQVGIGAEISKLTENNQDKLFFINYPTEEHTPIYIDYIDKLVMNNTEENNCCIKNDGMYHWVKNNCRDFVNCMLPLLQRAVHSKDATLKIISVR